MKLIQPSFEIFPSDIDTDNINTMIRKIESAARLCYKTEDSCRETIEESARWIASIAIDRRHESILEHGNITINFVFDRGCCYTEDTKVLTETGFKYFYEILQSDKIYTLTDNNEIVLSEHNSIIDIDYTGDIYQFQNKTIDLAVTPNHKMWVYDYNKRSEKTRIWKFIQANKLNNRSYKFNKSDGTFNGKYIEKIKIPKCIRQKGCRVETYPELNLDPIPFMILLGIWITDGSVSSYGKNGSGNRISITQLKKSNREIIKNLLNQLSINFSECGNDFRLKAPQLFDWLCQKFINGKDVKKTYYIKLPTELKELEHNCLEALLKGILIGDGTKRKKGGYELTTASKTFAEDIVEICLKLGKTANIFVKNKIGKKYNMLGTRTTSYYNVSIYKRENFNHLYKKNKTKNLYDILNYNGRVYCLELPKHHRLFVMRNGKSCWCGNSHELVRHRHAGYSMESTRYCNYSKDKFNNEINVIQPFFFDPMEERKEINIPDYNINNNYTLSLKENTFEHDRNVLMNSFDIWF
nr:FAD-dependent thymidylate synthase [Pseudomonadota bacterium]